eukprot:IDg16740t1
MLVSGASGTYFFHPAAIPRAAYMRVRPATARKYLSLVDTCAVPRRVVTPHSWRAPGAFRAEDKAERSGGTDLFRPASSHAWQPHRAAETPPLSGAPDAGRNHSVRLATGWPEFRRRKRIEAAMRPSRAFIFAVERRVSCSTGTRRGRHGRHGPDLTR